MERNKPTRPYYLKQGPGAHLVGPSFSLNIWRNYIKKGIIWRVFSREAEQVFFGNDLGFTFFGNRVNSIYKMCKFHSDNRTWDRQTARGFLQTCKKLWKFANLVDLGFDVRASNYRGPGVFQAIQNTLPETNIAPENGWLEDEFPFGMAQFQGLC